MAISCSVLCKLRLMMTIISIDYVFQTFFPFSANSVNVIEKHPNMRSIESTNKKNHVLGIVDVCCFQGI